MVTSKLLSWDLVVLVVCISLKLIQLIYVSVSSYVFPRFRGGAQSAAPHLPLAPGLSWPMQKKKHVTQHRPPQSDLG